jgi:hypothetical protein
MGRPPAAYPRGVAVDTAPESVDLPLMGAAPRWLRGIFWANLVAQVGIVITGGIVRVTGSGTRLPDVAGVCGRLDHTDLGTD